MEDIYLPIRLGRFGRILLLLAMLSALAGLLPPRRVQAQSPSEVLALVNALRAANGLPPYRSDSALMAAAQLQSDHMASIGAITHSGPGGSSSKGRAIAAGYGGGATVGVTENVAAGVNMTPQQAVNIWQGDSLHLNTMLSPNHVDAGVGVAVSGNMVYYTLVVGYISGQPAGGETSQPAATPAPGQATRPPSTSRGFQLVEVQTATPQPDGTLIHEVKAGEVLLNIAEAYEVELVELLELNNLTDKAVIYPGQKLTIATAEPTPTPSATPTLTPSPTPTRRPTWTPTATAAPATPAPTLPTPQPTEQSLTARLVSDPLLMAIGGLALLGVVLLGVGTVIRSRPPK